VEEGLLLILAVFAIAVFAILFFFFSKKFVYNHFKNQQLLTLQTYKACPKSSCRLRSFFVAEQKWIGQKREKARSW
jgi:flagellar basal body-associated protein FliL